MADQAKKPMHGLVRTFLLAYLLLSSALVLYLVYTLWGAVPKTIPPSPAAAPEIVEQGDPADPPEITQIDPETVTFGTGRATFRVLGRRFTPDSQVQFDGVARDTDFVNQNQLVVALFGSDFVDAGMVVVNVTSGEQTSNAVTLLVESPRESEGEWKRFGKTGTIPREERLLLLVIFTGAFGACMMALQSLADFRGQKKLYTSWTIHYLVRPPLGAGVALVFYLVIRGGFLAGTEIDAGATTPFGIVAVSALVGMFSDRAILKLREIFLTLFKVDDDRGDKLPDLAIETTTLPDAPKGQPYSHTLQAHNGQTPYKWSAKGLPAGLTLDARTGELSGTPTAVTQKMAYKFTVTDAKGDSVSVELELEVT